MAQTLRPVVWMVVSSVGAGLLSVKLAGDTFARDVFLGMLGPLVAACGTWLVVERASRLSPDRVTSTMLAGFGVKLLFFGAYVAAVLKGLDVHPRPFVVSFTAYFVALYATEALMLGRLFNRTRVAPQATPSS